MSTTTKTDPTQRIIQQLLKHNKQLLESQLFDIFSFDTINVCLSEFVDYTEYPSKRIQNLHDNYKRQPELLRLLLPYCDEFIKHPGACYQYDKGNFYININWVKNTIGKVGYEYIREQHSTKPQYILNAPFNGDYLHVMLRGYKYIFNYVGRNYGQSKTMMDIRAITQVFISDCLNGEKLYVWLYYYIAFLLLTLIVLLITGDVKNSVAWANPRFSHRYAPLVFYSLQEKELSGLAGVVDCNKSLVDWWEPTKTFYEDMVKIQCKRLKTVC